MKHRYVFHLALLLSSLLLLPMLAFAQVTRADYERAAKLRERLQGLTVNVPERANWIGQTTRFWYRKTVKGGNEFVLVEAETTAKRPALTRPARARRFPWFRTGPVRADLQDFT